MSADAWQSFRRPWKSKGPIRICRYSECRKVFLVVERMDTQAGSPKRYCSEACARLAANEARRLERARE